MTELCHHICHNDMTALYKTKVKIYNILNKESNLAYVCACIERKSVTNCVPQNTKHYSMVKTIRLCQGANDSTHSET